mmetsp:Transcript_5452/g.10716  ORF Transcript_5452/g.10716 Transcript_5452/m.10716 type:complete len:278 (-) Transcript_5452:135-968(-)
METSHSFFHSKTPVFVKTIGTIGLPKVLAFFVTRSSPITLAKSVNTRKLSFCLNVGSSAILPTTSKPSDTLPKTIFSSSKLGTGPGPVVIRNDNSLYPFLPRIYSSSIVLPSIKETVPGLACFNRKDKEFKMSPFASNNSGASISPSRCAPCCPAAIYLPGNTLFTTVFSNAPDSTNRTKFFTVKGAAFPYKSITILPRASGASHKMDVSPNRLSFLNPSRHTPTSKYTLCVTCSRRESSSSAQAACPCRDKSIHTRLFRLDNRFLPSDDSYESFLS